MVGVEVRTMATPENQSLAGEKMAIRIDAEIKSCRVFSSSVMNVFQCLFADGKEFTFIISRRRILQTSVSPMAKADSVPRLANVLHKV